MELILHETKSVLYKQKSECKVKVRRHEYIERKNRDESKGQIANL